MRRRRRYLAGLLLCSALAAVPDAAPAASGRTTTVKLSSDGEARVYRVFDPAGRDAKKPAALIVALHGAGGNGAKFQRRSGWDDVAERAGALVAYPSSFERGWRNNGDVDVRFLTRVIKGVSRSYKVDKRRVYFTGHSSGAFMTYRVACELADRVAAIGPVAGAPVRDCAGPPARPVPVIHVHGTADARIPYLGGRAVDAGGKPFGQSFPSAKGMIKRWLRWDACRSKSSSSQKGQVRTQKWRGCDGGAEVRLVTLDGWTHTFPNREANAPIDAPTTIWAFLKRFSIPKRA